MAAPSSLADLEPRLLAGAEALGLALDAGQVQRLLDYLGLIAKWNRVYNVTAVRNTQDMLSQHLLDSLSVIPALRRQTQNQPFRLLDVGAGAGLPGVVIAIALPQATVNCVDTVAKKASFIRQVSAELRLRNLEAFHARVEQLTPADADIVTSRAFASLRDFVILTRDHLKPAGVWMAMKGKPPKDEIASLPENVDVFHVEPLTVPQLAAERCLIWMRPLPR